MNLKVLIGILLIIIIINIAAVDTYLYFHLINEPADISDGKPLNVTSAESAGNPLNVLDDGRKQGKELLTVMSDKQREQLRSVMSDFQSSTGEFHGRIKVLDDEIFNLLQEDPIQKDKISQSIKEICSLRMDISRIAIDKMLETKTFLTKEQQGLLFSAIFRTKSKIRSPEQDGGIRPGKEYDKDRGQQQGIPSEELPPKENRLNKMSQYLDLTKEQSSKISDIMNMFQSKYSTLQKKEIKDPAEYEREIKSIKDEEDAQIEKMLTDAQKEKFREMKMEGRERRGKPNEEREKQQP